MLKVGAVTVGSITWAILPSPGHLDLSRAPFTLQVMMADHTDDLSAAIDGICNVLYDGFTWKQNILTLASFLKGD